MKTQRYTEFLNRQSQTQTRPCAHEGCQEAGLYRAPKDRYHLNLYIWFCLPHVKDYNASWNYYANMNETEVERRRRADITWERPTWPMGRMGRPWMAAAFMRAGGFKGPLGSAADFFHSLNAQSDIPPENAPDPDARFFLPHSNEHKALLVLELEGPTTFSQIKIVYRQLVKQFHPDANQGCKLAEERVKKINNAYSILKRAYKS